MTGVPERQSRINFRIFPRLEIPTQNVSEGLRFFVLTRVAANPSPTRFEVAHCRQGWKPGTSFAGGVRHRTTKNTATKAPANK